MLATLRRFPADRQRIGGTRSKIGEGRAVRNGVSLEVGRLAGAEVAVLPLRRIVRVAGGADVGALVEVGRGFRRSGGLGENDDRSREQGHCEYGPADLRLGNRHWLVPSREWGLLGGLGAHPVASRSRSWIDVRGTVRRRMSATCLTVVTERRRGGISYGCDVGRKSSVNPARLLS